jgi:hypothetical protein
MSAAAARYYRPARSWLRRWWGLLLAAGAGAGALVAVAAAAGSCSRSVADAAPWQTREAAASQEQRLGRLEQAVRWQSTATWLLLTRSPGAALPGAALPPGGLDPLLVPGPEPGVAP